MHFNDFIYRQKLGTAMGTKGAPTYATLVLGYLEEKLFSNIQDRFGHDYDAFIGKSWKSYLDDCFIIWDSSENQLKEFVNILNTLSTTLKFTMESDSNMLPFLDVMVIKREERMIPDVYYKLTDTKQYLIFDSCHPRHTRNNIPYNLARRLCTIISDTEILELRLTKLQDLLFQRNYPIQLIQNGINNAKSHEREHLLLEKINPSKMLYHTFLRTTLEIQKCLTLLEITYLS